MPWTNPKTFVPGVLTAADLNTYLRDNMNETMVGKASAPGRMFVTAGENEIVERNPHGSQVTFSNSVSSGSYTDFSNPGPTLTCATGTSAIVCISAEFETSTDPYNVGYVSVEVSGASSIAAWDGRAVQAKYVDKNRLGRFGVTSIIDTLTPGSNTFKLVGRVSGTGCVISYRELVVIPL